MSPITISKLVIGFAIVLIIIALNMNTAVEVGYGEYVNNIGLMNEKQTYLILGGIMFIGGIILFATAKLKQTPEDEMLENEKAEKLANQITTQISGVHKLTSQKVSAVTRTFSYWWAHTNNKQGRIGIFIFTGLLGSFIATAFIYDLFFDGGGSFTSLVPIAILCYLLLPKPAYKLMSHILILHSLVWGALLEMFIVKSFVSIDEFMIRKIGFTVFFLVTSLLLLWIVNKYKSASSPIST